MVPSDYERPLSSLGDAGDVRGRPGLALDADAWHPRQELRAVPVPRPRTRMAAGTSTVPTVVVASRDTATARPNPVCWFEIRSPGREPPPNTG